MADIVNLQRARKDKARKDRQALAEVNRVTFGRTKAERTQGDAEATLAKRRLDGLEREPVDRADDPSGTSGTSL